MSSFRSVSKKKYSLLTNPEGGNIKEAIKNSDMHL